MPVFNIRTSEGDFVGVAYNFQNIDAAQINIDILNNENSDKCPSIVIINGASKLNVPVLTKDQYDKYITKMKDDNDKLLRKSNIDTESAPKKFVFGKEKNKQP